MYFNKAIGSLKYNLGIWGDNSIVQLHGIELQYSYISSLIQHTIVLNASNFKLSQVHKTSILINT